MSNETGKRTGGRILVDALALNGADTAFCVPGESYLAVLDALHDTQQIRTIVCRQEGGAAMMAEAHGKLTGRPGICFVTRGPGASNASSGLHVAAQDSTPMILFIGQVDSQTVDREGFQEVDYKQMFGGTAKFVGQINNAARVPEYINRAFQIATSGRPGPVVLALPEDMLTDLAEVADAAPSRGAQAEPAPAQLAALRDRLARAERPLLVVGGGVWSAEGAADAKRFAERNGLPVFTTFRRQDYVDSDYAGYAGFLGVGMPATAIKRARDSDLILALGTRLGDVVTDGYAMFDLPRPKQAIVHVHPDPDEIGRVWQADLGIVASPIAATRALAAMDPVADPGRWAAWTKAARADYIEESTPRSTPGAIDLSAVVKHLSDNLPADAIITNGAGNYATWAHRYYRFRRYRTQLAPTSGSMGYGLPAAVAAKLAEPHRQVVCFAGDGCLMMTVQELATAVQFGAAFVVIVFNNGIYGTIRMHQERHYPGRVSGTDMVNPDFAALARAFGGHGETVERTDQFAAAFQRAAASGKVAVIDLKVDPEALTTRASLSEIRAAAIKKQQAAAR
ncbi:MAG: thiamine pyrophosphate-binding protein [Alphaproteobacteria bacterium]|nr:thiamine pyrophosphate-binding protein [Alphaproteobacteria bacterium]